MRCRIRTLVFLGLAPSLAACAHKSDVAPAPFTVRQQGSTSESCVRTRLASLGYQLAVDSAGRIRGVRAVERGLEPGLGRNGGGSTWRDEDIVLVALQQGGFPEQIAVTAASTTTKETDSTTAQTILLPPTERVRADADSVAIRCSDERRANR